MEKVHGVIDSSFGGEVPQCCVSQIGEMAATAAGVFSFIVKQAATLGPFVKKQRKEVGATFNNVQTAQPRTNKWRIKVLAVLSGCARPNVALENMLDIIRSVAIQELGFGFPIQPPLVERAVCETHKAGIENPPFLQVFTSIRCLKRRGVSHSLAANGRHVLMADRWVKIAAHSAFPLLAININN